MRITPSQRVSRACAFCAKQRLRCDGKEPCARCLARRLQCVYLPRTKRRGTAAAMPPIALAAAVQSQDAGVQDASSNHDAPPLDPALLSDGAGFDNHDHHHQHHAYVPAAAAGPMLAFSPDAYTQRSVTDATAVFDDPSMLGFDFSSLSPICSFSIWDWMTSDEWSIGDNNNNTIHALMPEALAYQSPFAPALPQTSSTAGQRRPAAATHPWPMEWDPAKPDNLIEFPDMTAVSADVLDAENYAHVPPMSDECHARIAAAVEAHASGGAENLHFRLFRPFRNGNVAPVEAFSVFVQLFFEYFHPTFPVLHQPTFDTGTAAWQLVLATAAIGCRYSKLPGALQYAVGLQELLRRVVATTAGFLAPSPLSVLSDGHG